MSKNLEQIVESLSNLTVLEAAELSKMLEEKWGVSAAAATAVVASASVGAAPAEEEKTEFDVVLVSGGDNKIGVIKAIREITGLGLKEAKDASEGSDVMLKSGVSKKDAEDFKKKLADAGASVKIV